MGIGKSLKKVGHKISHGVKKMGKSVSFKRGAVATIFGGPVAGLAVGQISNAHNKHKAKKKKNKKNSIFEGNCNKTGCCGKTKSLKPTSCSGVSAVQPTTQCQQYNQNIDCNMFMNFISNIFDKLLGLIEKLSGQQQIVNNSYNNYNYNNYNDYNTYNSYNTTNINNDTDNILNNNLSVFNNKIDNDIYNYNVVGNGNHIATYDA